jgi:toxin secretion/phage lysis holin
MPHRILTFVESVHVASLPLLPLMMAPVVSVASVFESDLASGVALVALMIALDVTTGLLKSIKLGTTWSLVTKKSLLTKGAMVLSIAFGGCIDLFIHLFAGTLHIGTGYHSYYFLQLFSAMVVLAELISIAENLAVFGVIPRRVTRFLKVARERMDMDETLTSDDPSARS